MTAEPDLLPSSIAAFTEALHGDRGSLDAWLEANDEHEVAAHVEAYARANVEHALAPLQAEVEALRAEVEKLRALAACAYQMAGMHDAPLVWLDRLSEAANGDALPDVDTLMDELLPYQPDAVCEAEAENKRLRAEVDFRDSVIATHAADTREYQKRISQAEAHADKLAKALRRYRNEVPLGHQPHMLAHEVDALLNPTTAQENDDA